MNNFIAFRREIMEKENNSSPRIYIVTEEALREEAIYDYEEVIDRAWWTLLSGANTDSVLAERVISHYEDFDCELVRILWGIDGD